MRVHYKQPPADADKAVNAGVAAHITANAPGGPHYNSNQTPKQRSDAANGIWLCQNCAHIIDANGGVDHPVDLLKRWKKEHEEKCAASIGKPASTLAELAGSIQRKWNRKCDRRRHSEPDTNSAWNDGVVIRHRKHYRCADRRQAMTGGAHVSFGVRCTRCGSSFGTIASVAAGGVPSTGCPKCGGNLIAAHEWSNLSNFTCSVCGTRVSLMVSNGPTRCPGCGASA